jgi:hypothetical protein
VAKTGASSLDLEPVRGPIGQWLHKRRLEQGLRAPAKSSSAISEERRRRLEEVSALMDEAGEPDAP